MAQLFSQQKTEFNILGFHIRVPRVKFPQITESLYLPSPPRNFLLFGIYVLLFYLVSGGIYIQIRIDVPAMGVDQKGEIVWILINMGEAYLIESFVACICIFLAGFGFILLIEAQKNAYDYGYSLKLMIIGLFFISFCFGLLQWMIWYKNPRNHIIGGM